MAIYTERTIRVNNNQATMDKDIYVYRGNRNIEIQFNIVDHQFKFRDINLIEQVSPSHAYVTLLTPQMLQIGTGKAKVENGVIKLVINSAMIDEKTECGDYTIVIDLYDEIEDALITIPPIENQLHVLDRMTEIDDIPDELRFIFDEQTGNLEVVNIDVTYDETSGEIQTIEHIPLKDKTARRLIENVEADNVEQQEQIDRLLVDMIQAKTDIAVIDPIVEVLQDSGYSQIKSSMNQEEIQNILNKRGIIIFREGVYILDGPIYINSNSHILIENEIELSILSGTVAISLDEVENVTINGKIVLNECSAEIHDCKNVIFSKLEVKSPVSGIGVVVNNGENVSIIDLHTENCTSCGLGIVSGDNSNIIINKHTDVDSLIALLINSDASEPEFGRIQVLNSSYVVGSKTDTCIAISNTTNSPVVIIDKAFVRCDITHTKPIIYIMDENADQVLGNVEIVEPKLVGNGIVNKFIEVANLENQNSIGNIKIIRPRYEIQGDAAVKINGDISDNNSIFVELEADMYSSDKTGIMTLCDDIRTSYILPENATSSLSIDISNAPVGYTCEFTNLSSNHLITITNNGIDNSIDDLILKFGDYVRLKHVSKGKWTTVDENFRNKLITVEQSNYVISIPNARYVYASIIGEVRIQLPDFLDSFTEIHLFVSVSDGGSLVYPEGIKWTNDEPELEVDGIYEFIFTKVRGLWLIGCVTYV